MMPWVVMFLLKVALLGKDGKDEIGSQIFNRIANDIWHLQSSAVDLGDDNFELKLRAMVLGQAMYQRDTSSGLRELVVQGSVFNREDGYYNLLFNELFGLSLDSFLTIAMFIIVRLDKQVGAHVVKMPISELMFYLCSGIPYAQLLAFIRLASCDIGALSSFVEGYDLGNIYSTEYFQETPFKYTPFVLEDGYLIAFNYQFCITALGGLAPAILKKERPSFKDEFGRDMERRVGEILAPLSCDMLIDEDAIRLMLKAEGVESKLVDFLIREGDQVTLVECKAVEPTDLMKCTSDPVVLKKNLQQNYIKAIHQGQAVADALARVSQFNNCDFRLLVVTYGDHYIFGGEYILANIDMGLVDEISTRHKCVPVPMRRISYLSLQDFAGLIHGLNETGRPLSGFLDTVCDDQSDPQKRRITLAHSIPQELGAVPGAYAAGLGLELDRRHEALTTLIESNLRYWSGKVEPFIERHTALIKGLNPTYQDLQIG